MTNNGRWLAVFTLAALAVGGWLWYAARDKPGRMRHENVRAMKFPKGLPITGDDKGVVCHEIWLRSADGSPDRLLRSHMISGKDWVRATEEQRRQWVIEDTLRDFEDENYACAPENPFFRSAWAQPYCPDCGGECAVWSCPGRLFAGQCSMGGTTCVITVICCAPSFCEPPC